MHRNAHHHDQPGLFDESCEKERATPSRPAPASSSHRQTSSTQTPKIDRATPPLPRNQPLQPLESDELWTINDVAHYLGVPKQTVYSWRHRGYGPQGFRVGKHLRWHATTVIQWTLDREQDR